MTTHQIRTALLTVILGASGLFASQPRNAFFGREKAFDQAGAFKKGDLTGDGLVDMRDVMFLVESLYWKGPNAPSFSSADLNRDKRVDERDIVVLLSHIFLQGPLPKFADRISDEEISDEDLAEIRLLAKKVGIDLKEADTKKCVVAVLFGPAPYLRPLVGDALLLAVG